MLLICWMLAIFSLPLSALYGYTAYNLLTKEKNALAYLYALGSGMWIVVFDIQVRILFTVY